MEITAGFTARTDRELVRRVARYRRKVFVDGLSWPLQTLNGLELDQFDDDHTVYVAALDASGEVAGCARLLPTTRPYLLSEVFPQLMRGQPLPRAPQIWELSRFAAVDIHTQPDTLRQRGPFSSPVAVDLLRASLACAQKQRAHQLITVSPVAVERLLRSAGFRARRAAAPVRVNGHWLFACLIDCVEEEAPRPHDSVSQPGRHALADLPTPCHP